LEDARLLIKGLYKHLDDDDDIMEMEAIVTEHDDAQLNLNRATLSGRNDVKHELKLNNFEEAV